MKILLIPLVTTLAINLSAAKLIEFNFENGVGGASNGAQLNTAYNSGTDASANWNFGGAQQQTRNNNNGHLNVGYTHYYKGNFSNNLSDASPSSTFRTVELSDSVTGNNDFTFSAVIDAWQLNPANMSSDNGRGIRFLLNDIVIGLKLGVTENAFGQVYSQGGGNAFQGYTSGIGASNTNWLTQADSSDTKDLTLQIRGNTQSGLWTSWVSTGVNGNNANEGSISFTQIGDGSGLTTIDQIQLNAHHGDGDIGWGTSSMGGNQPGAWVTVDHISLDVTAVPETSTYALIAGFAAFLFVAVRGRK